MKVLLDGRFIGFGGGGVFTARCYRELIPLLLGEGRKVALVLTPRARSHPDCAPLLEIVGLELIDSETSCLTLPHHWRFRKEVRTDADVYFYPHFDLPWLCPYESIVFIHDLFPAIVPGYTSWFKKRYFDAVCARAVRTSRAVITNSQWTKGTRMK